MKRALVAALVYFSALFALGFALGTIRVLFIVPRVGQLAATLTEVPVMLVAAFFICSSTIRHWRIEDASAIRWSMVACFLALLIASETLFGAVLFGRTTAAQLSALATPAGLLGLFSQLIAALLPMVVGRAKSS